MQQTWILISKINKYYVWWNQAVYKTTLEKAAPKTSRGSYQSFLDLLMAKGINRKQVSKIAV